MFNTDAARAFVATERRIESAIRRGVAASEVAAAK
jgi:hypothetical protein